MAGTATPSPFTPKFRTCEQVKVEARTIGLSSLWERVEALRRCARVGSASHWSRRELLIGAETFGLEKRALNLFNDRESNVVRLRSAVSEFRNGFQELLFDCQTSTRGFSLNDFK
jgi:hypothetical protein